MESVSTSATTSSNKRIGGLPSWDDVPFVACSLWIEKCFPLFTGDLDLECDFQVFGEGGVTGNAEVDGEDDELEVPRLWIGIYNPVGEPPELVDRLDTSRG